MKKHIAVLGSLCAGVMIAGASFGPAKADGMAAFGSFHVEILPSVGTTNGTGAATAYGCLVEWYGAVVNNCSGPVSLVWDLPTNSTAPHGITVQDYWGAWPAGTPQFTCTAYAYDGTTATAAVGTLPNFTAANQYQTGTVQTGINGKSFIQLICWSVPPGAGIASISWAP